MVADGSMAAFKTGTAIPNLNFQALVSEHAVLLPTDDILDCFETATRSMEAFAHTGVAEKLVGVRNLLLPKLVSGQFDIRQPNLDDDSQRTLV